MTTDVERTLGAAAAAKEPFAAQSPESRYIQLVTVADALDAAGPDLIPIAMRESNLPEARLAGELRRTTMQLRMFAEEARSGRLYDVRIDAPDPGFGSGPRPDLRFMRRPIGVVLNFAASNFPFAFSVAGGDTASALASGCPVVVKAHEGHPEVSARTAEVVTTALAATDAPEGAFGIVFGREAGVEALNDDRVDAATFTGSVRGGLALAAIAAARPRPIPFYGELGSINPVVVTPAALAVRGEEIATGFVESFTLGSGQFCTKPGILLLPAGHGLDETFTSLVGAKAPGRLLTAPITSGFLARHAELTGAVSGRTLIEAGESGGACSPGLVAIDFAEFAAHHENVLTEVFGPFAVIVEYHDQAQLAEIVDRLEGSLTFTIQAEDGDHDDLAPLLAAVTEKAGRILLNGWPTGVAVTPAQHHGGPFPATTNPLYTAVGTAATDRFLRPVAFQNFFADWLPEPLRDDNPWGVPQQHSAADEWSTWGRP